MDRPALTIEKITNKNNNNNVSNKDIINIINENIFKDIKYIEDKHQNLYQIIFSKKENHIKIKCNDTSKNSNDIYTKKLFYEECKSNKYLEFIGNISGIFDLIKTMNERSFIISKTNNSLNLKIFFIHLEKEYPLEIVIQREQDLLKTIEELNAEIENLKIQLEYEKESKKEIMDKLELNNIYNIKYDNTLYKLEDVYNSIIHDIIQKRKELGLINYGIRKYYNKNIKNCILSYKCSEDGKMINYKFFEKNLFYPLIVILTTDKKRFGFFYQNNNKYIVNSNNSPIYNRFTQNICGNCNLKEAINIQRIFSTCCKDRNSFVFSLDGFKIYQNSEGNPNFNIKYDSKRECHFGNEFILREKKEEINQNIGFNYNLYSNKKTECYNSFILNSFRNNSEFNIVDFEVYNVKLT